MLIQKSSFATVDKTSPSTQVSDLTNEYIGDSETPCVDDIDHRATQDDNVSMSDDFFSYNFLITNSSDDCVSSNSLSIAISPTTSQEEIYPEATLPMLQSSTLSSEVLDNDLSKAAPAEATNINEYSAQMDRLSNDKNQSPSPPPRWATVPRHVSTSEGDNFMQESTHAEMEVKTTDEVSTGAPSIPDSKAATYEQPPSVASDSDMKRNVQVHEAETGAHVSESVPAGRPRRSRLEEQRQLAREEWWRQKRLDEGCWKMRLERERKLDERQELQRQMQLQCEREWQHQCELQLQRQLEQQWDLQQEQQSQRQREHQKQEMLEQQMKLQHEQLWGELQKLLIKQREMEMKTRIVHVLPKGKAGSTTQGKKS